MEVASRLTLLILGLFLIVVGCADPRNPPTEARDPGYTETIVLWQDAVSSGNRISATFNVASTLAPINQPGVDHPARLTIAAYIAPDADIIRFESLVNDSFPAASRVITSYQTVLDALQSATDSLNRIDTAFTAHCDPCAACPCVTNCDYDTCGMADRRVEIAELRVIYGDSLADAEAYRGRLGAEADQIFVVVDDRYRLALWMDSSDWGPTYPEAVFSGADLLSGQEVFLARTDTTTNMKGRGFELNMDSFEAADPSPENYGYSLEVNWTTCFIPPTRPCLKPGSHTMYAQLTGVNTRITGTIVLVYEGERP
ncbi:hypothetical protein HZB60_07830 [candidate division KSB1 bacterium]|nr:hypothetical protein [candidate division KSB1 bacterium]